MTMDRAALLSYLTIEFDVLWAETDVVLADDDAGLKSEIDRTFAWLGVESGDLPTASTEEDEACKTVGEYHSLLRLRNIFGARVDYGSFEEQTRNSGIFGHVGGLLEQVQPRAELHMILGAQAIGWGFEVEGLTAANDGPTVLTNATTFTATITGGTGVSYRWDFGDNLGGVGSTPAHTYAAVGTYTAIVTAINSEGRQTATTEVTVTL